MSTNIISCKSNKMINGKYCDEFLCRLNSIWFDDNIAKILDEIPDSLLIIDMYEDEINKEIFKSEIINKAKYKDIKSSILTYISNKELKLSSIEIKTLYDFINLIQNCDTYDFMLLDY